MKKIRANQKGFTLVELIVVVAILGVLAAVAVPNYMNYLYKSRINADIDTARAIINAARTYAMTSGIDDATVAGDITVVLEDADLGAQQMASFDGTISDVMAAATIDVDEDYGFTILFDNSAESKAGKYGGEYLISELGPLPTAQEEGDVDTALGKS